MKCGANGDTTCTARQGDQCMEHLMTDTPSCPSRVPLTNADRIRAMTDEELAAFLEGLVIVALGDYSLRDNKRRLDWLKQEVKE
jgi:hypothetical protein